MITQTEVRRIKAAKVRSSRKKPIVYPDWYRQTAGAMEFEMPDSSVYRNQAELYRLIPAVVTAVDQISKTAATSRLNVLEIQGDERVDIPNHRLELLLEKPNPVDSSYEFDVATTNFRWLAGNCYWWLNKSSEFAEPTEIWTLPPHKVTPVPDGKLGLRGYLYEPGDGQEIALETWEIVHFKRFNPFNEFIGLSAIEAIAVTAIGDQKARAWNTNIFADNNGRLEGILAFAQNINTQDWERMKRDIKDASKKREQMMLRGVGKGGVEWMQSKLTPREMEFLSGLDMNEKTIYNVLAPGLLTMLSESSNEANARVGEAIFTNKTVWPWLEEKVAKINQALIPYFGDNLIAEHEDIRVSDRALKLQEMESYAKTHTVDEIRKEYYNDDEIGDERGVLLPAEIGAASSQKEEVPEEITQTVSGASIEEANPEETAEEPVKSELEIDLDKWRRKAGKKVGESVPFDSKVIPHAIRRQVLDGLGACKSKAEVNAVFDAVLETPTEKVDDISGLVALLDFTIKAMNETQDT